MDPLDQGGLSWTIVSTKYLVCLYADVITVEVISRNLANMNFHICLLHVLKVMSTCRLVSFTSYSSTGCFLAYDGGMHSNCV